MLRQPLFAARRRLCRPSGNWRKRAGRSLRSSAPDPDTIVFTSGGTEANNLAILGGALTRQRSGRHTVTTAVEHASVAAAFSELERQGFACERLVPGADGGITARAGHRRLREDTVLVSIMLVNNETGARFPLEEITLRYAVPHPQALIHCDAVQAAGKLPIRVESLDVDLLTISGHKLHAPKGCGALYIKKGIRLLPRALGGEQEKKRRAGTEAVPLIAAFGAGRTGAAGPAGTGRTFPPAARPAAGRPERTG